MAKKIFYALFIIAVIAAVILGLKKQKIKLSPALTENKPAQMQETKPEIVNINPEQLPKNFPADFEIEKNAVVLQNYNFTANGVNQATRRVESQKTMAENYKYYLNYLISKDWNVTIKSTAKDISRISATKDKVTAVLSIYPENSTASIIDFTFETKN